MKRYMGMALLAATFGLSVAGCKQHEGTAMAAKDPQQVQTSVDALLQKMTNGQVVVQKTFKADNGLIGFVIKAKQSNKPEVVFTDAQGRYLFFGPVLNMEGKNLTEAASQSYVQPALAAGLLAKAGGTAWFQEGDAKAPHQLYVVAEPNCSVCHMLYNKLEPMIKAGKVSVRWILVAFMKPDSAGKVAAILSSSNPNATFAADEKGYNMATETGSLEPMKTIPADMKKKIEGNMRFFTENGLRGTPAIIYVDQKGDPQMVPGYPKDLNALVTSAGKLPVATSAVKMTSSTTSETTKTQ